jgi:hypothetical protein
MQTAPVSTLGTDFPPDCGNPTRNRPAGGPAGRDLKWWFKVRVIVKVYGAILVDTPVILDDTPVILVDTPVN